MARPFSWPAGRIAPWHQTSWDWRAATNFACGGAGTGLLLFAALARVGGAPYWPLALPARALIGCGLTAVWFEIGRPWRAINVFFHPGTSWMTREALVAPPLFACGLAAAWLDRIELALLTATFGLGFLYCQARMLNAARGIPAWREPTTVPLLIATGLAEGGGLSLLGLVLLGHPYPVWLAALLALALVARYGIFERYRHQLHAGAAPGHSVEVIDQLAWPFIALGLGVPLLLLLGSVVAAPALGLLAGLSAFAAGWLLKYTLITWAAHNQGFAVPNLPGRGSAAPGLGTRPGWSPSPHA